MTRESRDHLYFAYGLTVVSELPCPELVTGTGAPDVVIREGSVPMVLGGRTDGGICFETAPGRALVKLPGVARYLIRDGREVIVDRVKNGEDAAWRILLTTCLGILLQQRGEMVLHASTVARDGRAVALAGISSVGKSTLAAAFSRHGWMIVADEATRVSIGPEVDPMAVPGAPTLLLWSRALKELGVDVNGLHPVRRGLAKYALSVHDRFASEPQRLTDLCVLVTSNREEVAVETLTGFSRFRAFLDHTFREPYQAGLGLSRSRQAQCASVVPHVRVHRLTWPQRWTDLDEAVDLIQNAVFADTGATTNPFSSGGGIHGR